jgi:hypothetical protein
MIVSNSTHGPTGALQGIDFLARSGSPAEKDSPFNDFSELLGGSDGVGSAVSVSREARLRARGPADSPNARGQTDAGATREMSQSVDSQAPNAPAREQSVVAPVLDEPVPIFRDPRLDDPVELALEAAAIALAASLLSKPQEPTLVPVSAEELTQYSGSDQSGGKGSEGASSEDVEAGKPVSLALPAQESTRSAQLQVTAEIVSGESPIYAHSLGVHRNTESQAAQPAVSSRIAAETKFVAAVVLTATQQQTSALAENGASLLSVSNSGEGADSRARAAAVIASHQAGVSVGSLQAVEFTVELAQVPQQSALGAEQSGMKADPDAEFLASTVPVNPASAFFAAQVQQPRTQSSGNTAESDTVGESEADQTLSLGLPSGADAEVVAPNSLRLDEQSAGGDFGSKHSRASHAPGAVETQSSHDLFAQDETELGTLGAGDGSVHSEASPALERTEESSTPVTARGQESSSLTSASADFSSTPTAPSSLPADSAKPGHPSVSRPTVLPPVNVRSSELFNVVQNALERARSENPSHLAVEVTLDDGSSFGLEVRMGVSGLQASFRSESQPLLKFLENGWAGFLAKEAAESKVVSAAFEGRSGFGEFSNNGSNAGERRQQFEDNSAAARLASSDLKSSPARAAVGEAEKKLSSPEGGMAVYA